MTPSLPDRLATGGAAVGLCAFWLVTQERGWALLAGGPVGVGPAAGALLWALAVVVLLVVGVAGAAAAPLRRWPWAHGAAVGIAAAAAAVPVGHDIASGPWISAQPWAWAVRWGLAAGALVGMAIFGRLLATQARARWLAAGAFALSVGLSAADHFVLPGQQTAFHLLLHGLVAAFLLTAAVALPWGRIPAPVRWIGAVLTLAGCASTLLTITPATRAQVVHRSQVASRLLGLAGPPAPQGFVRYELEQIEAGASPAAPPLAPDGSGLPTKAPDGSPWNVLFVTVDTLRSDALAPSRGDGHAFAKPGDTPFLDDLAARSTTFRHAYAQASITHLSMPAMFRSSEVFESDSVGRPLGMVVRELGMAPAAVVNNYFLEPRIRSAQRLLEGFEHVEVYELLEMGRTVPLAKKALEALKGQRFFLWVHFYQMHKPGFAGHLLKKADGNLKQRYRKALRWLDGQLKLLDDELERHGVRDRTLTLLMSDHGEALGANGRTGHGSTIYEEEMTVPLYLHVPGMAGRIVDDTVGNIDVVPTLYDLLGAPPEPLHRGRSLAALMMGRQDPRRPTYYLQSNRRKFYGVARGHDKLVHAKKAGAFMRFDTAADPTEDVNLYATDPNADLALMRSLLRLQPNLFQAELKAPEVLAQLGRLLEAAGPQTDRADLDLLLRLAALAKKPKLTAHGARLFEALPEDTDKLRVIRRLGASDSRLQGALVRHMKSVEGTPRELELAGRLAAQRKGSFPGVAKALQRWAESGTPEQWTPWLHLIRPWANKSAKSFAPVLGRMLDKLPPESSQARLVLDNLSTTTRRDDPEVAAAVRPWLAHAVPGVRALAAGALGSVGDPETDSEALLGALKTGGPIEMRAAVHAASRVMGAAAVPALVAAKEDKRLALDVVEALKRIATQECVAPLEDVAENHYNPKIQDRAKKALKHVRRRVRKRKR